MSSPINKIWHLLGWYKPRLITEIGNGLKYKIIFPCSQEATIEANRMARRAFGKENFIDPSIIEGWRIKNEKILSVLVDSKFNCRGYFDLIPLTESFYKALSKGEVEESDIRSEHILGSKESPDFIYIGGVTSNDNNPIIGSLLLTSILLKLKYLYNKKPIIIGAIAATDDGEHYLREFGFEEASNGKGFRKDGMSFYQREVHKGDVDMYLDEWGRRSNFLDYTSYRWYMVR